MDDQEAVAAWLALSDALVTLSDLGAERDEITTYIAERLDDIDAGIIGSGEGN